MFPYICVPDRSKITEEEYDAFCKLIRNPVLISSLGDVFKQAVSTILNEFCGTCQLVVDADGVNLLGGDIPLTK
jgi:NAD(P)H-hydrate repair Nnr-like enzyme with NAD(P)H-hydrate dehydratase domain